MAYDQEVAARVADMVNEISPVPVQERKMFGGIAYMVQGNMCVAVGETDLMVRVGKEERADAAAQPHVRPPDTSNRSMGGFVFVAPEGFASHESLAAWVQRGLDFALSLPPK